MNEQTKVRTGISRELLDTGIDPKQWGEKLREDQVLRWRKGEAVRVEDYIRTYQELVNQTETILDLIYGEILLREKRGEKIVIDEYIRRFPYLEQSLRRQWAVHALFDDEESQSGTITRLQSEDPLENNAVLPVTQEFGPLLPMYELQQELGRGGCGVVYRARQRSLNRLVALKMIEAGHRTRLVQRFQLEAEAIARLQHPNIVQIYEIGELGGRPFIALEYVNGGSLESRLKGKPVPFREAAELIEKVARAIHCAHQAGIIHRDLKPGNILLQRPPGHLDQGGISPDLVPKIVDFGMAKIFVDDEHEHQHPSPTKTDELLGTPYYMAPEQAKCSNKEVGPATDVYALGAILYELLTGRPPFRGETLIDVLTQVAYAEPVPPGLLRAGLPSDLETICLKCLNKEQNRRYRTAEELADDLRRFLNGEPIAARPVRSVEKVVKWAKRRPGTAALISATVLTIMSALGAVTVLWQQSQASLKESNRAHQEAVVDRQNALAANDRTRQALALAEEEKAKAIAARTSAEHSRNEADKARGESERNRIMAEKALHQAESNLHAGQIALADRAILTGQLSLAARHLQLCPTSQRGWEWYYLRELTLKRVRTYGDAVGRPLAALALRTQSNWLAAVGSGTNSRLTIWDIGSGNVRQVLEASDLVQFSRDGRMLAARGRNNTIRIWDIEGDNLAKAPRTLSGFAGALTALCFSPNNRFIAAASQEGEIRIWEAATGKLHASYTHTGDKVKGVTALAFVPNSTMLLSAGDDHQLRFWNLLTPKPVLVYALHHPSYILCLAFRLKDKSLRLVTGSQDGHLRFWSLTSKGPKDERPSPDIAAHTDGVQSLMFDRNGLDRLVSVGRDGYARIWNHEREAEKMALRSVNSAMFGRSAQYLFALQRDGTVNQWDVESHRGFTTLSGLAHPPIQVVFSPDDSRVAVLGNDKSIQMWDTRTQNAITVPTKAMEGSLALGFDATGICWAARTLEEDSAKRRSPRFALCNILHPDNNFPVEGCNAQVTAVVFSGDGRHLAAIDTEKKLHICDVPTRKKIRSFDLPAGDHPRMAMNRDGSHILVVTDRTMVVWNLFSNTIQFTRPISSGISALEISPRGDRVALANRFGVITIWLLDRGQEQTTLTGHSGAVIDLSFNASGTRLASAGSDGDVRVWDPVSGHELLALGEAQAGSTFVVFSWDGTRLATVEKEKSIRLWSGRP